MIVPDYPYKGREDLIRQYSDQGYTIRKVGETFEMGDTIDRYPCPYTYEETENPIEPKEGDLNDN